MNFISICFYKILTNFVHALSFSVHANMKTRLEGSETVSIDRVPMSIIDLKQYSSKQVQTFNESEYENVYFIGIVRVHIEPSRFIGFPIQVNGGIFEISLPKLAEV